LDPSADHSDDDSGDTGSRSGWLLAGASGFLGQALADDLRAAGISIRRLVRGAPSSPEDVAWDARTPPPASVFDGISTVVCLSGVSLQKRWTDSNRRAIVASRVQPTRALAEAIAALPAGRRPTLLSQSASGYYPKNTGRTLTERDDEQSEGFVPDVVRQWEAAAAAAVDAGARVVFMRTGVVLSPRGGALQALQLPAKFALGVPLGSGRQVMPLVSLPDWIAAVRFLADRADVSGPVNITMPVPATNAELTSAVNAHLHRPQPPVVKVPAAVLRLALDGFATELLDSVTILPQVLTDAGFTFAGADVTSAVDVAYRS
jgi:uncharacterized protein (TIGR01777 family)